MNSHRLLAVVATCAAAFTPPAQTASVSATFSVQVTLYSSCIFNTGAGNVTVDYPAQRNGLSVAGQRVARGTEADAAHVGHQLNCHRRAGYRGVVGGVRLGDSQRDLINGGVVGEDGAGAHFQGNELGNDDFEVELGRSSRGSGGSRDDLRFGKR